jgi:hypothetical protein
MCREIIGSYSDIHDKNMCGQHYAIFEVKAGFYLNFQQN